MSTKIIRFKVFSVLSKCCAQLLNHIRIVINNLIFTQSHACGRQMNESRTESKASLTVHETLRISRQMRGTKISPVM
ncbi:CLUMA_CG007188, isoform A [Clunio marinus]|uniref:CLUMA_CG007188, isoform A n=1 Tax=Clunio marinus TaxID=568069 RepID=A0A1J1I0D4_9DIPT|nr:CLUMA_CG007188, isoform A [Clunio marinus]